MLYGRRYFCGWLVKITHAKNIASGATNREIINKDVFIIVEFSANVSIYF